MVSKTYSPNFVGMNLSLTFNITISDTAHTSQHFMTRLIVDLMEKFTSADSTFQPRRFPHHKVASEYAKGYSGKTLKATMQIIIEYARWDDLPPGLVEDLFTIATDRLRQADKFYQSFQSEHQASLENNLRALNDC